MSRVTRTVQNEWIAYRDASDTIPVLTFAEWYAARRGKRRIEQDESDARFNEDQREAMSRYDAKLPARSLQELIHMRSGVVLRKFYHLMWYGSQQ